MFLHTRMCQCGLRKAMARLNNVLKWYWFISCSLWGGCWQWFGYDRWFRPLLFEAKFSFLCVRKWVQIHMIRRNIVSQMWIFVTFVNYDSRLIKPFQHNDTMRLTIRTEETNIDYTESMWFFDTCHPSVGNTTVDVTHKNTSLFHPTSAFAQSGYCVFFE